MANRRLMVCGLMSRQLTLLTPTLFKLKGTQGTDNAAQRFVNGLAQLAGAIISPP